MEKKIIKKHFILIKFVSAEFTGLPSTLHFLKILFYLRSIIFFIDGKLVCHMVCLHQALSQGRSLLWACTLGCLQQQMQHRQSLHPPVLHRC